MKAASTNVASGRRRREIGDIEIKTKFAFAKLRVFDNKDIYLMGNKSSKKAGKYNSNTSTCKWFLQSYVLFFGTQLFAENLII